MKIGNLVKFKSSVVKRCTDKTVQAQHLDALKDKDAIIAEVKAQYYPEEEVHAQA